MKDDIVVFLRLAASKQNWRQRHGHGPGPAVQINDHATLNWPETPSTSETARCSSLLSGHMLWDTNTGSVHLDEPHWITSRVSEKTEYNNAGNFKSWHIDCAAGLLDQRKTGANVWDSHINTLLCRVFADSTLDWRGDRNAELSRVI